MRAASVVLVLALAGVARADTAPASRGLLLVVNKGDRTLGILDPAAGKSVATVALSGVTGHEVAASPDGKTAYVPIFGDSGVGRPGSDGRTIDVPKAPQEVLVRPDGRVAYVSCDASAQVAEIDLATWSVARLLPAGKTADGLAWAPLP